MKYTYEEIVEKVREIYEYADARNIFEHIAIQVNIEGEIEGCFYIEIAGRKISVEPYDYYDRDILATIHTDAVQDILEGVVNPVDAYKAGKIIMAGDESKILMTQNIKFRNKKGKRK